MHLFTYGSLMFPQVWSVVVRDDYDSTPAEVTDYVRRQVKGDTYPAVVAGSGEERLQGRLYYDINKEDQERLDQFEGEYYRREVVTVILLDGGSVNAEIYVLRNRYRYLLSDVEWDPRKFERDGLDRFFADYGGFVNG